MKNTVILRYIITFSSLYLTGCGQSPTFISNFEDQNLTPEIGIIMPEHGTSGKMWVARNPHPDARNSSDYVLRLCTNIGTGGRAEYSAGRYETNEKKYIYTWKRYHAPDMFKDIKIQWAHTNQWKTWPCEHYGDGEYEFTDAICYSGGIFNDIELNESHIEFRTRAYPDCNIDYGTIPKGHWNEFVLEIYWTNTDNGYYKIWRNDTLFGYGDGIKTLMDGFLEGTCDMYWSNGLYTYWEKTGARSQDSLIAYVDDIAIYDIDKGYTIDKICPDCGTVLPIPTDTVAYRVNLNYHTASSDGYNNFIVSYNNETYNINLLNTNGQSSNIDIYLFSEAVATKNNTLTNDCFPSSVITTNVSWSDTEIHKIYLMDLDPDKYYTFKLLGATSLTGANRGTQIGTSEENRDTVFAAGNTCNMAVLTNLVSDKNGDLTIYVKSIDDDNPRGYINAIEIVEYTNPFNSKDKKLSNELFPNPVKDILHINVGSVPKSVTIYTSDGRKVKFKDDKAELDVSALPKGVYIASIETEKSTINRRFIKD